MEAVEGPMKLQRHHESPLETETLRRDLQGGGSEPRQHLREEGPGRGILEGKPPAAGAAGHVLGTAGSGKGSDRTLSAEP